MARHSLSGLQLDALCEAGGIGAGHAATALANLLGEPVGISIPSVQAVDFLEVPQLFGGPESLVAGVYTRISGEIGGGVLFMADAKTALDLVARSMGGQPDEQTALTLGQGREARFRHVASLAIAAYVAAMSRLTRLDILPFGQSFGFDMAGALLEAVVIDFGESPGEAVLLHAALIDDSAQAGAAMFFIPDREGLPVLLARLGVG